MMNRTISTMLFGLLLLSLLAMLPIGWLTYYPRFISPDLSGQHLTKSSAEYYDGMADAISDRALASMMIYGGQTDDRRVFMWRSTEEFPSLDFKPELEDTLAPILNAVRQDLMNSVYDYSGTDNIFQIQLTHGLIYVVYYEAGKNLTQANVRFAIAEHDNFYQTLLPSAYEAICAQSNDHRLVPRILAGFGDPPWQYVYLQAPNDPQDKVVLSDTVLSEEELTDMYSNLSGARVELGDLGHLWVFGPKQLLHTEMFAMMWLLVLWIIALWITTVLFIRGLRYSGNTAQRR
jgi:hypothetical protein